MAIINVALSDTFDQWRTKTNTLGTNQGDLANLDAGFAGSDLVSCLNELRSGEDLTQLILGDSSGVDNNRIKLGDSADLQIYHSGTNSNIDDLGTGDLQISSNGTGILLNKGGSETMAKFLTDGAVELYHNNVKKLETTATGVNVTGEVDMDTLKMPDNTAGKILVGDSTSYEEVAVSGDATLASSGALTIGTGAVTSAKIADNTIVSADFNSTVTLNIKNSSGTVLKTLRSPGS